MKVKSSQDGKSISVSVENVTTLGIWLFAGGKEYFLSYIDFPYFNEQTLGSIQDVKLLHGTHLYWPRLDVDLELDNLINPQKYPLKSRNVARAAVEERGKYLEKRAKRAGRAKFKKALKNIANVEPDEAEK